MKVLGVILLVAGLIGLIYGGFSYTKERKVIDIGPIEAKVDEKKTVPIPPIAGAAAVLAGATMVVASRRRTA